MVLTGVGLAAIERHIHPRASTSFS